MKTRILALGLALALGPAAAAAQSGSASMRDLQRLQDSLANLDEGLAALDADDPRTEELHRRADEVREDLIWLKVEMRRHQRDRGEGIGASKDDVEDIQAAILDLQEDVEAALRRSASGEVTLPEGTEIQVRLEDRVSSATARREDRVEASVALPLRRSGFVVVPAGTRVRGWVREAEAGERPARGGRLDLVFDALYLDEERVAMRTRVVSLKESLDSGDTAKKAGIGAALGGVLGSILGGKKGAVVGVVVGGTGGVLTKTGEDVVLPPGTILTLTLDRPLVVRPR